MSGSAQPHRNLIAVDVPFVCNVCGSSAVFRQEHWMNPELASCGVCRSNVRFRWIVHRLSTELFGHSLLLRDFPRDKSIKGVGLSDPAVISTALSQHFLYLNTYLTSEPRLDLRHDPSPFGELDFLIASEVFEHIEPPVPPAFKNAARLLKNSGVLLMTAPWVWDGDPSTAIPELYDWRLGREDDRYVIVNRRPDGTVERFWDMAFDGSPGPSLGRTREHFPFLSDWRLSDDTQKPCLVNTRADGSVEMFHELVFHEGPGLALEMRLFTKDGIEQSLRAAGFTEVQFEMQDYPEFGIIFGYPWSRPLTARKMALRLPVDAAL
jgi:SAM-dependent methyltransferase